MSLRGVGCQTGLESPFIQEHAVAKITTRDLMRMITKVDAPSSCPVTTQTLQPCSLYYTARTNADPCEQTNAPALFFFFLNQDHSNVCLISCFSLSTTLWVFQHVYKQINVIILTGLEIDFQNSPQMCFFTMSIANYAYCEYFLNCKLYMQKPYIYLYFFLTI